MYSNHKIKLFHRCCYALLPLSFIIALSACTGTSAADAGSTPQTAFTRALDHYNTQDYLSALSYLKPLAEAKPANATLQFNLGNIYYALHQLYPQSKNSYLAQSVVAFKRAAASSGTASPAATNLLAIQLELFLKHHEKPFYALIAKLYEQEQLGKLLTPGTLQTSSGWRQGTKPTGKYSPIFRTGMSTNILAHIFGLLSLLLILLNGKWLSARLRYKFKQQRINPHPATKLPPNKLLRRSMLSLSALYVLAALLLTGSLLYETITKRHLRPEGVIQHKRVALYPEPLSTAQQTATATVLAQLDEGTLVSIVKTNETWSYVTLSHTFASWLNQAFPNAPTLPSPNSQHFAGWQQQTQNTAQQPNDGSATDKLIAAAPQANNSYATLSLSGWVRNENLLGIAR